MGIFKCNHCSQVAQTSAAVNTTRLKTHLSQLFQKCPGEVKTRVFNLGQAAKKQWNIKMFGAPDPEADTPKFGQIRGQILPSLARRPRNAADTMADTPDTGTFSIWPLVVGICVSANAYFTAKKKANFDRLSSLSST
jgi:hypothetical protein